MRYEVERGEDEALVVSFKVIPPVLVVHVDGVRLCL
jgi:hypothetical protein